MMKIIPTKRSSQILLVLSILSLFSTLFLIKNYRDITQQLTQEAKERAEEKTSAAAAEINYFLSILKPLVDSLVHDLNTKKLTKNEIEKRLKEKPTEVSGFGVAFEPHAFDQNITLYAPYYAEKNGVDQLVDVGSLYNYTKSKYSWFTVPLKKGAGFRDPYFGKTTKTFLVEYAAPFYSTDQSGKKKIAGIVYANQSVEHLKHILSTLYLGQTGYWFIISKNGSFLVHPQNKFVTDRLTIFDLAKQRDDSTLESAAKKAIEGKDVFVEYRNEMTDRPSWLLCKTITTTGWSLCGVFDKSELHIDIDILRKKLMQISLMTLLFLILFVLFLASLFIEYRPARLWTVSLTISLILGGEIGTLWYFANLYPDYKENLTVIRDKSMLYSYLIDEKEKVKEKAPREKTAGKESPEQAQQLAQEKKRQLTYRYEQPTYVPTGIYVSHIQFVGENQISFVGYIWQRYIDGVHDHISKGFVLPQASSINVTELSRTREAKTETIIWQVQTTLNQYLSYARYPFDVKDLHIQLWHKNFDKNIILIPDLDSYRLINPRSLPGLSRNTYLAGWEIQGSHFGYIKNDYNTVFGMYARGPFGIYEQVDKSTIPELYFDITVKRRLIDTFAADLLPLSVAAALLFVALLTIGAQGYAVLASYASVFFALAFAQARFRAKVPSYQLIYFENFYFVLYFAIVVCIIVSILYLLNFNIPFIRYRNNMASKLLFWPILLFILIVITLHYLY